MASRDLVVMALALALSACSGGDDEESPAEGPVTDPGTGLTVAACGMPRYQLLPRSEVGKLLAQDATAKQWKPAEVDSLVKLAKVKLDAAPHGVKLYRYRYDTQDKGKVVEVTGVLAFPDGGAPLPAEPVTLLSLHGTSGWSDACSPGNDLNFTAINVVIASRGFVVVAPDYIGMNSFGEPPTSHVSWMVGEPTAIASWDALPAAAELLKQVGGGLSLSPKVVLAGASQGGHAVLFTERVGQYYAPEYQVLAQAAIVPASSVTRVMSNVVSPSAGKSMIGIIPPIFVSYRDWYGSPKDLRGVFTDTDPHHFAFRADEIVFDGACTGEVEFTQVSTPEEVFEQSFLDAARADFSQVSPWACFAQENSIVTTSNAPKSTATPMLFTVGEKDELLPGMESDVAELCARGFSVEHLSCAGAGHVDGALWGLADTFSWLQERVAGKPVDSAKACKVNPPVCCSGNPACP